MELDRKEIGGIIKKVTQPTKWVSAMHIMHKPRNLNSVILREHFKLPTREEVMAKILGAKYFPSWTV